MLPAQCSVLMNGTVSSWLGNTSVPGLHNEVGPPCSQPHCLAPCQYPSQPTAVLHMWGQQQMRCEHQEEQLELLQAQTVPQQIHGTCPQSLPLLGAPDLPQFKTINIK